MPDPMPDRIRVAWFAIKNKWYSNEKRKEVKLFPHTKKKLGTLVDEIPKTCRNVKKRGVAVVEENFEEMICRNFPSQLNTSTNNDWYVG